MSSLIVESSLTSSTRSGLRKSPFSLGISCAAATPYLIFHIPYEILNMEYGIWDMAHPFATQFKLKSSAEKSRSLYRRRWLTIVTVLPSQNFIRPQPDRDRRTGRESQPLRFPLHADGFDQEVAGFVVAAVAM